MSVIDNYGDFELPEEKSVIEVDEDPVKTVLSIYDLYDKVAVKKWNEGIMLGQFMPLMYEQAEKLLKDKQKISFDEKQIKRFINELVKKEHDKMQAYIDVKGLFLSAIHNCSSIETLVVEEFEKTESLGYKLNSDKKLVIGPKVKCIYLGNNVEGGIVLNYSSKIELFGTNAKGGIQIHKGSSPIRWPWNFGIQIINYEESHHHYEESQEPMKGFGYLPVPHKSNTRLKFEYTNDQIIFRKLKTTKDEVIIENNLPHVPYNSKPPIDKINITLNTPELLAIIKDDDFSNWKDMLQKVTSFNWQQLQNDLAIICEKHTDHQLATMYKK